MTDKSQSPKMIRGVLNKDMLREWIAMVSDPALQADQCWWFNVMHRSEEGLECIHSHKIEKYLAGEERERAIEQLIQFTDEQSVNTSCSYRMLQTFKVTAHVDDKEHTQARSMFTFTIQPPKNIADDPGEEDSPDNKGTLVLMQRTTADAINSKDKAFAKMLDMCMEDMANARNVIRDLVADSLQAKVTTESLLDRKAEREWTIEKERKDRETWDKLTTIGLNIGGNYLINSMIKKGVLPETPIVDFNAVMAKPDAPALAAGEKSDLHKLIDTMTPEQMIAFVGGMTLEQQKEMMPAVERILPQLPQDKIMKFMALYQKAQADAAAAAAQGKQAETIPPPAGESDIKVEEK